MYIAVLDKCYIGNSSTISPCNEGLQTRLNDLNIVVKTTNIKEIETVPDYVKPYKYCYTKEQGFYENPDWVEPTSYEEEIKQTYRDELAQEVSKNGYDA